MFKFTFLYNYFGIIWYYFCTIILVLFCIIFVQLFGIWSFSIQFQVVSSARPSNTEASQKKHRPHMKVGKDAEEE